MELELTGKVALVTGGSSGIGKACARELAQEGADVVICARRPEPLEAAARELSQETGRRVLAVPADTSNVEQVNGLVQTTVQTLGRVDILVNNAGMVGGIARGPLADVSDEDVMEDVTAKFMGYLRCARAVIPHMKRQGWGRIINVGGLAARQAGTIGGARNLAVVHLTKNLSEEMGPFGITANVIHPGATRTERTSDILAGRAEQLGVDVEEAENEMYGGNAIRRIVEAREIAYLVCFLASPKSVSITGEVIAAGGGVGRAVFV